MLDELEKLEDEGGVLEEKDAAVLVNSLLSCVNYCHQKGLVHRDLKLENILLHDSDYNDIKLIDFGLARHFEEDTRFDELVGTPYYVAPEVLEQNYGYKSDLWSLGIIAYMVLGGFAPFEGETDRETMTAIINGAYDFNEAVFDNVSDDAKDFIQSLLVEEDDRPTAQEALQHSWLQNHRTTTLKKCQNRRTSTRESLVNLSSFHSRSSILKQATCAMMASQHSHCEDVKDIGRAFQALDQTCSGKLSKADFKACIHAMYLQEEGESDTDSSTGEEFAGDDIDIDGLFEQVNFSRTGDIHYSEFVGACLLQKNVLDGSKLRQVFQTYDKENKGYITRDNLKDALSINTRVSDVTIDKIMNETDRSGTGQISFDDFCAIMMGTPQCGSGSRLPHSCSKNFHGSHQLESRKMPYIAPPNGGRKNPCQISAKGA